MPQICKQRRLSVRSVRECISASICHCFKCVSVYEYSCCSVMTTLFRSTNGVHVCSQAEGSLLRCKITYLS